MDEKETKMPVTWQRWVCGTFAILGVIVVCSELFAWFVSQQSPSLTSMLSSFLVAPFVIYTFGAYALTGRLPSSSKA